MIEHMINKSENIRKLYYSDLTDFLQWKRTLAATVIFVMIAVIQISFGYLLLEPQGLLTVTQLLVICADGFRLTVPVFGVLVGYDAIAAEHETQRLRLYLSVPYVRQEFFFGRLLSRLSWMLLPVGFGLLISVLLTVAVAGVNITAFALFIAATLLLGSVFVSLSVATSAVVQTSRSALFISLGFLAFFYTSWWIPSIAGLFFSGTTAGATVVNLVDPTAAYRQISTFLEQGESALILILSVISLTSWVIFPIIFASSKFQRREI